MTPMVSNRYENQKAIFGIRRKKIAWIIWPADFSVLRCIVSGGARITFETGVFDGPSLASAAGVNRLDGCWATDSPASSYAFRFIWPRICALDSLHTAGNYSWFHTKDNFTNLLCHKHWRYCISHAVIMVALCNRADHYIFALWNLRCRSCVRQGDHHVGHWPTFKFIIRLHRSAT